MAALRNREQDKEATVYIGNLDERVTDPIVWELMIQVGRIQNVHLPKDRVTQTHQGYGFVEFQTEEDADYAARVMNQVRLFNKPIRVNKASADKSKPPEIGAELFVGNLDTLVDEKTLYDTFSRFGPLVAPPKIARDENGLSKGYSFISYGTFEAADDAIAAMNGKFLSNKAVNVQYAFKKDGKGERHGDDAERLLASKARTNIKRAPGEDPAPNIAALFAERPSQNGAAAVGNAVISGQYFAGQQPQGASGSGYIPLPPPPTLTMAQTGYAQAPQFAVPGTANAAAGPPPGPPPGAIGGGLPSRPPQPPPGFAGYPGGSPAPPPGLAHPPPGPPPGFGAAGSPAPPPGMARPPPPGPPPGFGGPPGAPGSLAPPGLPSGGGNGQGVNGYPAGFEPEQFGLAGMRNDRRQK